MSNASIGSISHGTLRPYDLLQAFANALRDISTEKADIRLAVEAKAITEEEAESEKAAFVLEELFARLDELSPPYCYFGSNEGDGADFGFWPSIEAIEDLPSVTDPNQVPIGEDCRFVNDHGNVTVYSSTGEILLELV